MTAPMVSKIALQLDGEVRRVMSMKQNKDNLRAQRVTVDDVEDIALDSFYPKRRARPVPSVAPPQVDLEALAAADAEDEQYREGQRDKYRKLYALDESDEDTLEMMVVGLAEHRKLGVDLKRAKMPYRERLEMLKEMRQLRSDHGEQLKALGIDRATRDSQSRDQSPMDVLREQMIDGKKKVLELIDRTAEYAAMADDLEELRALLKQSWTIPAYDLIDPWLVAYDRVHGRPPSPQLIALSQHNDNSRFRE